MYSDIADFGHHLIVGLAGTALLEEEQQLLSELSPSGVILFGKNIDAGNPNWLQLMQQLLQDVRSAVRRADLLISIDHEGGRVHRFPAPVSHFPAARAWGDQSGAVGEAIGCELRALGFNLDFAPVLDCQNEPQNNVIGDRAFSCAYDSIAPLAISFAHGLERHGVLSCGKHFPGHGGTIADSHHELPVYSADRETLITNELLPFAEFIRAGLPLMMTAHVLYPNVDPANPASLSKTIIGELLRGHLGFDGCVITDDLEMKALAVFSPAEKAVKAMQAGSDLLLEANYKPEPPVRRAYQMAEGLLQAVTDGQLSREAMLASRGRVDALLAYAQRLRQSAPFADYVPEIVGCKAHSDLDKSLRKAA